MLTLAALVDQRISLEAVPVVTWLLQVLVIPAYASGLAVLILANQLFGLREAMPVWFAILSYPLRVLPFIALDLGLAAWRYITD